MEIGSNDGTFLSNFNKNKIYTLGIEPSNNVAKLSKKTELELKIFF